MVSGTGGPIVGWEMLFCQRQVGTAQGVLSIAGLVYPMGPIVLCSFIIGPAMPSMAIGTLRLNTNVFTTYHCLLLCQVNYSKGCISDTYYGAGIGPAEAPCLSTPSGRLQTFAFPLSRRLTITIPNLFRDKAHHAPSQHKTMKAPPATRTGGKC